MPFFAAGKKYCNHIHIHIHFPVVDTSDPNPKQLHYSYLEAVARHGPCLVELTTEAVEADDEGLGAAPHEEHEAEGQRPEREQEEVVGERGGAQRPQRERHVHRRHDVHHVRQEHEPRRPQRAAAVLAVVGGALQRPRPRVQRPAQPVQRRHEQAEVAAPLAVVQAQVPGDFEYSTGIQSSATGFGGGHSQQNPWRQTN